MAAVRTPPTPGEAKVVAIYEERIGRGLPHPSLRELANALGCSESTIKNFIKRLKLKGYIVRHPLLGKWVYNVTPADVIRLAKGRCSEG